MASNTNINVGNNTQLNNTQHNNNATELYSDADRNIQDIINTKNKSTLICGASGSKKDSESRDTVILETQIRQPPEEELSRSLLLRHFRPGGSYSQQTRRAYSFENLTVNIGRFRNLIRHKNADKTVRDSSVPECNDLEPSAVDSRRPSLLKDTGNDAISGSRSECGGDDSDADHHFLPARHSISGDRIENYSHMSVLSETARVSQVNIEAAQAIGTGKVSDVTSKDSPPENSTRPVKLMATLPHRSRPILINSKSDYSRKQSQNQFEKLRAHWTDLSSSKSQAPQQSTQISILSSDSAGKLQPKAFISLDTVTPPLSSSLTESNKKLGGLDGTSVQPGLASIPTGLLQPVGNENRENIVMQVSMDTPDSVMVEPEFAIKRPEFVFKRPSEVAARAARMSFTPSLITSGLSNISAGLKNSDPKTPQDGNQLQGIIIQETYDNRSSGWGAEYPSSKEDGHEEYLQDFVEGVLLEESYHTSRITAGKNAHHTQEPFEDETQSFHTARKMMTASPTHLDALEVGNAPSLSSYMTSQTQEHLDNYNPYNFQDPFHPGHNSPVPESPIIQPSCGKTLFPGLNSTRSGNSLLPPSFLTRQKSLEQAEPEPPKPLPEQSIERDENGVVVMRGFVCPEGNYDPAPFEPHALKIKREYVYSWTQWPQIKNDGVPPASDEYIRELLCGRKRGCSRHW